MQLFHQFVKTFCWLFFFLASVLTQANDGSEDEGQRAPAILPFSEAVRAGDLLFLSGQIGTDDKLQLVSGSIEGQSHQMMQNIKAVLERNNSSMSEVIKCTVFLSDIKNWPAFNEVYVQYFKAPYPARSALAASGLALGALVEVECIAHIGHTRN